MPLFEITVTAGNFKAYRKDAFKRLNEPMSREHDSQIQGLDHLKLGIGICLVQLDAKLVIPANILIKQEHNTGAASLQSITVDNTEIRFREFFHEYYPGKCQWTLVPL